MKLHSVIDVITNSSSVVYCTPTKDWKKQTTKLLDFILQGTDKTTKDLFSFGTFISYDTAEHILWTYLDKEEIDGKDWPKVKTLIENYLASKNLSVNTDDEETNLQHYDACYGDEVTQGFLNVLIDAFGSKKPKLDCDFDDSPSIRIFSKLTGKSIDLEDAFRDIFFLSESYE